MSQEKFISNKKLRLSVFMKMSREELKTLKAYFKYKSNVGYSGKNQKFHRERFYAMINNSSSFFDEFARIQLETGFAITPSVDLTEITASFNKIFTFCNIHPLLLNVPSTSITGFVREYENYYHRNELNILNLIEKYKLNELGLTKDNFLSWAHFDCKMTLDIPDDEHCNIKDLISQLEKALSENLLFDNSNIIIVAEEVRVSRVKFLSSFGCDIVKANSKLVNCVLHYHGKEMQKEKQAFIADEAKKLDPIHVRAILGLKNTPQSLEDYIKAVKLDPKVVQYIIDNAKK